MGLLCDRTDLLRHGDRPRRQRHRLVELAEQHPPAASAARTRACKAEGGPASRSIRACSVASTAALGSPASQW